MEETVTRPSTSQSSLYALRMLLALPLVLFGGVITFVFSGLVGSYILSRMAGGPKLVDLPGFMLLWLMFGAAPLTLSYYLIRTRRSSRFTLRFLLGIGLLLLVVSADSRVGPRSWHALFRREKVVKGDAVSFKTTHVSPHLNARIGPGTNVVWCGTFQLAWNEACQLAGGNLQLTGSTLDSLVQSPMAAALNEHAFTKDSIDAASFVAMAGYVKDQAHQKIQKAVQEKFNGEFQPKLIPPKTLTPRPEDFVAYACLWKKLSFSVPFERLEDALTFGGTPTRAFGVGRGKLGHSDMYSQIQILDYKSSDDFVIELATVTAGDRLILAKVAPADNLGDTIVNVRQRVKSATAQTAGTNDVLIVPRVALDIVKRYGELEGHWLVPTLSHPSPGLFVVTAMQSIRFDMNEKGVELQSEAHIGFGCAKEGEPERPHLMIFDKPFLVLLERTGAPMPYFALWANNSEVLVR